MFGYIKPFRADLRIREFDTYQAIYCGLCRSLGHLYGPFARITLSYDFTFLAVLGLSLSQDDAPCFAPGRCPVNPLKKKAFCQDNPILDFSALCATLLVYYKARDSLQDHGWKEKLSAAFLYPFAAHARRKAAKAEPELDRAFSQMMERQNALEKAECSNVDEVAEPTAQALSLVFTRLSGDPMQKRVLERLGYLLGRYVYLCDALDDLADDAKKGNYNPFLSSSRRENAAITLEEQRMQAMGSLNLTTAELASAYALLNIQRFGPILENIIYQGLPSAVRSIQSREEKKHV